jgi:hypothetical protein
MLDLYLSTITEAARAAGIDEVRENPRDPESRLLPLPRVDVAWGTERITRDTGALAAFPTPGSEATHRTLRRRRFRLVQPVTVTVWAGDKAVVEELADQVLMAMPRSLPDTSGNRVAVRAERAVWGGFDTGVVDVMRRYSKAVDITFTALAARDQTGRWILDVANNVTHGDDNGQEATD